ncbi:glutamine-synthetase adenylyltransferase [Sinisalibacter aestuarii]|uniref:Glutamate-ammonia-ligase adenylyltransferase n=1 Tax=Sinisalibacter aestuarii TaxID=2949426 RepID=A0ABQ5LVC3_9RHOB|nr:glutamine-synthetase adenylyltransferase [Sinisalibacter aestuarii]GKY88950.1 glutamate-ammonia-ligase adenylyltransferase [Sinisalibacter aestuarii]
MTFAARITRVPLPFDADHGAEARDAFGDLAPELQELIEGAAGCSPYLKGLMERDADWLRMALAGDPDEALDAAIAEGVAGEGDPAAALRIAKRRVALLTGLADLAGVWPLETVTGALTRLADAATDRALTYQVGREIARGKLPGATEDDIPTAAGAVALAMGKMGAGELNYSSDIDLIMLFDESRFERDDFHEARASFIRATRRMSATLSEMSAEGYVFRTDLRLRPDPSVTPVILAMATAESYYESLGRTWERAAHIKARACAGDIAAGDAYLDRLRPFVWRKHLDFAAIQDAHDMRLRIRAHKGLGGPITLDGHDMKLGRGGIREIEFFTQTRQLISGGRDPSLRERGTVPGLAALAAANWVPDDVAELLTWHYRNHREIEHRVQMVRDAQTHALPTSPEGFRRLVMMMGETDVPAWQGRLRAALEEVHALTEGFFAPEERVTAMPEIDEEEAEIVDRWRSYPACRSARAAGIFERLKPDLLARLSKAARPREALVQFDAFLKGLPAGVQLFALFEANPALVDLIVDIAATAPALAVYLGRNSRVLEAVIVGDFFSPWPGLDVLTAALTERLAALEGDYEAQLDAARHWMKEWHFRIGVHHLRGLISGWDAGAQYSDLAEAVLRALWPLVVAEFAAKHGDPPGRGAALIGMGSLGARTISSTSDLDLIVIYDADGVESSDGRRPLAARAYFSRLTQAMVTALTAPMPEGKLYEVDMRLRPSGRQGPVATSIDSFRAYQRDEAWTWEHLALTRARLVAGDAGIGAEVEAVRHDVLAQKHEPEAVFRDVIDMRARIAEAKAQGAGPLDAKIGAGRLQDIELAAQCAVLLAGDGPGDVAGQLAQGVAIGWFTEAEAGAMIAAYMLLWRMQAAAKLLSDGPLDFESIGAGGLAFLLRETGMEDAAALEAAVTARAAAAQAAIEAALGRVPAGRVT